jgi:hypothetical protein
MEPKEANSLNRRSQGKNSHESLPNRQDLSSKKYFGVTKMADKRVEAAEMYHHVQQLREDEHTKKVQDVRVRDQRKNDLQSQIEENQRSKAEKARLEKAKDAALVKEYDRMMEEREQQRVFSA